MEGPGVWVTEPPDPPEKAVADRSVVRATPGEMPTIRPGIRKWARLCTVLTTGVTGRIVPGTRLAARVRPTKGTAPDVCDHTSADGRSPLSLTPASRTYAAEVSAAHDLAAHPSSAAMSDVRVDQVSGLVRQAFRETGYQSQQPAPSRRNCPRAGDRRAPATAPAGSSAARTP
ncbi:hypothetical protein OG601_08095 [Streptomyces sp. NBC_01239]|uniref:hypothetical protein n=1 Tax=Streptomyces sp. NBC_01239 TaxID=2903792 RepID=UPI0022509CC8|nr:hypothetical protein [Streptomyces sp. NBC_01239]MCX4810584.1 hypothetical protein [Streptomyces sp. NBC_01239]